jgi:hypothetical protein
MIISDMLSTRVTVTLPAETVREIDRVEKNRSRFVLEAVAREIRRRQRERLRVSLRSPHPESAAFEELGLAAYVDGLPDENVREIVDVRRGTPIRWVSGKGWAVR